MLMDTPGIKDRSETADNVDTLSLGIRKVQWDAGLAALSPSD